MRTQLGLSVKESEEGKAWRRCVPCVIFASRNGGRHPFHKMNRIWLFVFYIIPMLESSTASFNMTKVDKTMNVRVYKVHSQPRRLSATTPLSPSLVLLSQSRSHSHLEPWQHLH